MIACRFQSCARLKKNGAGRNLESLIGKVCCTAFYRAGLLTSLTSSAGEDEFIWRPQRAEGEHTVLEKATGTPGSLATTLIFLPKVSAYKQLGKTTFLR